MKVTADTLERAGMTSETVSALRVIRTNLKARTERAHAYRIGLGNMTGLTLAVTPFYGGPPAHALGIGSGGAVVAVVSGQRGLSYPFPFGGFYHASYVADRLQAVHINNGACDGTALALVLAFILDGEAGPTCGCYRHAGLTAAADAIEATKGDD